MLDGKRNGNGGSSDSGLTMGKLLGILKGGVDGANQEKAPPSARPSRPPLARDATGQNVPDFFEAVEFRLSQERYGVKYSLVKEIVPFKQVALVSKDQYGFPDTISLHGDRMPVLDTKKLLGIVQKNFTDQARAIIVHADKRRLCIVADSVQGISRVGARQLLAPPHTLSPSVAEKIIGVTPEKVIILDIEKILSPA